MPRDARTLGWPVVSVLFGLAIAGGLRAAEPEQGKTPAGAPPAKTAPGGIIVSRETTFITGPLRKDGSVDYLAALNERYAQGVTPENNAVIPLLQALGPAEISEPIRARFFKMLGTSPLPEKGAYLETFPDYCDRHGPAAEAPKDARWLAARDNAYRERDQLVERPWSKKDSPLAASWLDESRKQIDLIVAATRRPRFFVPLVAERDGPGSLLDDLLRMVSPSREAGRVLCARAMFRIAAGKPEEAWQDLLACHRLARLYSQGPYLVDELVAVAIEGTAVRGDAILAHEGQLTAEQARRFAAELRTLPPMTKMADTLGLGERLFCLDGILGLSRNGVGEIDFLEIGFTRPKGQPASLAERLALAMIDWNEPLRMANHWYDRIVEALSQPTRKQRSAAIADFDRELKQLGAESKKPLVLLRNIAQANSLRSGLGRHVGQVMAAAMLPALSAATNVEDRSVIHGSLVPVAFALAAYRADRGEYPADLAVLAPKYVPTVPEDVLSDGPLRYKREGPGYVLYSVGINGKDDSGRAWWDHRDNEDVAVDCDDIAIRVPAKEK